MVRSVNPGGSRGETSEDGERAVGGGDQSVVGVVDAGVEMHEMPSAFQHGRFGGYWLAQTGMADALGVLGAAGPATNVIELGTAVVPTWLQHPMALAASALTTQANTHGRLVLGIGLSHEPAVEQRWHMTWEKPIRHMLDYLEVLRAGCCTARPCSTGARCGASPPTAPCPDPPTRRPR
jgi:alkanesulfonate monooxygenase SsuD/methylene tetrahydromethanopterin reductase-like flavin-dependent oxidoreductase (luciferase family)